MSEEQFDRSSELGPAWTPATSGDNMRWSGMGFATPDLQTISISVGQCIGINDGKVMMYGRQPDGAGPDDPQVGAICTADSRCTNCGGPFLKGHAVTFDLAPNMAGTGRHTDCDDPKLEKLM